MSFSRIQGHTLPKQILQKALKLRTVSHAYLFYGPDSIGKKVTAFEFAKSLNCESKQDSDNCDRCSACQKIDALTHPDVFLVEPEKASSSSKEGAIRIEKIRDLQKKLGYLPYEGKFKVAIINDAHLMNAQSANSFLKTLEEPPSATVLILLAPNIFQLLPTLVSRCQAISFQRLSLETVKTILAQIEDLDHVDLRAARSEGQIQTALSQNIEQAMEERQDLLNILNNLSYNHLDRLFSWAKTRSRESETLLDTLNHLTHLLRDLAVIRSGAGSHLLSNLDLNEELGACARQLTLSSIHSMFDAVRSAQRYLSENANTQLTLENMLMSFCDAKGRPI